MKTLKKYGIQQVEEKTLQENNFGKQNDLAKEQLCSFWRKQKLPLAP
jgi:hypothetical protein